MKRLLLVIVALALAGCAPGSSNTTVIPDAQAAVGWSVERVYATEFFYRIVDTEHGIVCFTSSRGGIDCVKLSEAE